MSDSPVVRLTRVLSTNHGTFGVLRAPGWNALSIECPWRDNRRSISCIPNGQYRVAQTYSPRFKRATYQVMHVPDRSGVRIHSGNLAGDRLRGLITHFNGCIGLGVRQGVLSGQRAVLTSGPTVATFESLMGHRDFDLVIDGVAGG